MLPSIFYKKEIPIAFGYSSETSPRKTVYCDISVLDAEMPRNLKRSEYTQYKKLNLSIHYNNFYYHITKVIPIKDFEMELESLKKLYNSVPNPLTMEWLEKNNFTRG